jgi:transaldolase
MTKVGDLKIKIFADGADLAEIVKLARDPMIKGFTTNPTLMRASGVSDYRAFAKEVLAAVPDRPVSFEVFADDFPTMEAQAREIASWGPNVYVKIPVTNTEAASAAPLIGRLAKRGIKVNVTALLTLEQVAEVADALAEDVPSVVSLFCGRIADAGVDPVPMATAAAALLKRRKQAELLWASPREVFNVVQAAEAGCHIITVANNLLGKLDGIGRDLTAFSLDTVRMFRRDAVAAGFSIATASGTAAKPQRQKSKTLARA